ncbi:MAG: cation transporter, partial [Thermoleophilaceae bacterium]
MSNSKVKAATAVLHVGGMYRGSENAVVETLLRRRPGVLSVEANAAAQSAKVAYDPNVRSIAELRRWVEECGLHCAGRSVPGHICDPLREDGAPAGPADAGAVERAEQAHGHGGHTGASMDAMTREMRNRFLVALVFAVPIVLWSAIGRDVFGLDLPTPFGIHADVWQLLLSLPVVLYASSIFFTAAVAALRERTLDMMVLVAVAVGVGWLYSVAATFVIEGEVFYERSRCSPPSCCWG